MLSKFIKYSQSYHKIIFILITLMLLFIFLEKNFQFQLLNIIAHIFFGGLIFLFFLFAYRFFSRNITNIYFKIGLHIIAIVLAFISTYIIDASLIKPCTSPSCADKQIMDMLFDTIGLIIMISFTC
jgi:hypothetical protein